MPLYNKKGLAKASADHQSALNHIPGVSVPHCTKHIPGSAAVPVAIKCGGAQRNVSPTGERTSVCAPRHLRTSAPGQPRHAPAFLQT